MKINLYFLSFTLLASTSLFAQTEVEPNKKPIPTRNNSQNDINKTQAATDKIEIKNESGNAIMTIIDEGNDVGSINLPSGIAPASPPAKLYNQNGALYWSGVPLAYNRSHYFSAFLTSSLALISNTETNLTNFTELFDSDNSIQSAGIFEPSTGIFTIPYPGVYHFDFSTTWRVQNFLGTSTQADLPIYVIIKQEYISHGGTAYNYYKFNHFVHLTNKSSDDIFGKDNFDESVMFSTNVKAANADKFTFYVWYENNYTIELIGGGPTSTTISAFKVN